MNRLDWQGNGAGLVCIKLNRYRKSPHITINEANNEKRQVSGSIKIGLTNLVLYKVCLPMMTCANVNLRFVVTTMLYRHTFSTAPPFLCALVLFYTPDLCRYT